MKVIHIEGILQAYGINLIIIVTRVKEVSDFDGYDLDFSCLEYNAFRVFYFHEGSK